MTFTITYRGTDGAMRTEMVEAASRTECIAQCRARGVSPMGVAERRSDRKTRRSGDEARRSDRKTRWSIFSAAIVIIALVGGGVWWLISTSAERSPYQPEPPKPAVLAKEKKSAPKDVAAGLVKAEPPATNETIVADAEGEPNEYVVRFPGEKILTVATNGSGYITVKTIGADGRRKRHIVSPPPIFECPSDEIIMVALATPEGHELPPLPDLGGIRADAEFMKALEKPIMDKPGDSDEVRVRKEIVRAAREEIRVRMEAGEHFADIVADHVKLRNENGEIRVRAQQELNRIVRDGDEEGAKHYRDVMNTALSQMGISGIDFPDGSDKAMTRLRKAVKRNGERQGNEMR